MGPAHRLLPRQPDRCRGFKECRHQRHWQHRPTLRVDRVYVFKNHDDPQTGEHLMSQLYEWAHENVTAQIDNPELQNLSYGLFPAGMKSWPPAVRLKVSCGILLKPFAPSGTADIRSLLLVPINIAAPSGGSSALMTAKQSASGLKVKNPSSRPWQAVSAAPYSAIRQSRNSSIPGTSWRTFSAPLLTASW